jgi:hypothetical protein
LCQSSRHSRGLGCLRTTTITTVVSIVRVRLVGVHHRSTSAATTATITGAKTIAWPTTNASTGPTAFFHRLFFSLEPDF